MVISSYSFLKDAAQSSVDFFGSHPEWYLQKKSKGSHRI